MFVSVSQITLNIFNVRQFMFLSSSNFYHTRGGCNLAKHLVLILSGTLGITSLVEVHMFSQEASKCLLCFVIVILTWFRLFIFDSYCSLNYIILCCNKNVVMTIISFKSHHIEHSVHSFMFYKACGHDGMHMHILYNI